MIRGNEDGPVIMYNGHMDVVTEGNASDWEGYDPIGYSGTQESYVHTPFEKARLDYLKRSLAGNISMFLKVSELPKESFIVE